MQQEIKNLSLGGKLLIYGGTPDNDLSITTNSTAEVIDLLNEDLECDLYFNGHPTNIIGASGGRINDDFVYCGGSFDYMYSNPTKVCRILGKGFLNDTLHLPLNLSFPLGRSTSNGGVLLPNNTLFIAGICD